MPAAKKGKTIDIGFNVKAGLDPESGKQIEQSLGSIITKINSTQTKVKVGVDLSGISAAQVSQQLKAMFSGAKVNLSDSVTFDSSKTEAFSASTKKAAKEATESAKEVEQAAVKFKEATGAITKLQMNSAERDTEKLFGKAADLQAAGEGYDKLSDSVMKVVEAKEKLAAQPTKANHEDFKIQLDNAKDLVAAYQKASNVPDILAAGDGADGKKDNISSLQLDKARRSTEDLFNQVSKINGTSNAYIALCNSVDKVVDAYSELENMPSKGNLDKFKMQIAETGDIQKAYQENITAARDNLRRTFSEQYKSGSGVDYKEWESQFEELGVGQARESQLAGADNQTAMLTRRTEALRGAELATNDLLYATEELNKANQVFQTTQDRADLDTVRARVSDVKDQQRVIAEMQHLFTKDDTIYKGDNSTANMVAFANSIKGTKFESEGLTASIERLKQAQDQLNSDHSRESLETWREQKDLCQGQINNVRRLQTEDRKLIQQDKERLSSALQYKNILAESQGYYGKYQDKISKNPLLNDKFKELFSNLQTGNFGSSTEARTNLADLRAETKALGLESVSTKQKLTELFGMHLDTAIAMAGVHALTQALQAAYQNVVELDKKLVDLQVATGYSRKGAKELMSSYTQMGETLGATTSEVASAADDWLRQNKTINETNTLIKDSMMLAKLGQIDSKEATTDLTAVMKAYGISVQDASTIVDKFTKIDMQAATDAGSIATAMSYVATSAKDAGVDINKLTGYIASVSEVSQAGAEQVGTFLKTMFARASAIKEGKLVDPETQEDISSVEVALQNVGIHLRDAQGEFRNTGEVLDEVHDKWANMSNTTQAAVASAFAGTRQIDKFRILMAHYGTATEYATEATNSFGFATEKFNNTYLKGVEASQDKLKASFEQFSQDIVNSDFLSFLMRGGAEIINVIDAVTTKIGSIPTIAGVIGITKLIKDIKGFKGTVNGTLGLIGEDATTIKNFQGVASGTMSVNASQTLAASYANVREQLLLLDDAQRKAVMSELQRQGVDVQSIGLNEANAASMVRLNRTKAAEALYDANISEFQRRYAAQQILELDSTGALTQEKLTQIYASAGLRDAELEEAAARSTNTSAIKKEMGAGSLLKGAKSSIGNFLGSTSGKLTLIGAAIYAAYKAISYVSGTSDRAFSKFTDKTNELEQANSNVEAASNKHSELRTKIGELQDLKDNGTITLTQQKDLDNLELENSRLEAQLATLKEIAKAKEEAAAQSAYSQGKDYLNGTDTKGEGRWWKSFLTFGLNGGATWDVDVSRGASINDAIDKITTDRVASANIGKDGTYDGKSQQWYEEDLTAQSQFLSNSLDNLQSFHAAMKYYDNAANQQQKDSNEEFLRQQEYIVRMIMAINPESGAQSVYNYVTNDKNNSAAKAKLDDASKNGNISGDDLKKLYSSDKDVKAYIDTLSNLLGISLDDNGFKEMANGINNVKEAAENSTEPLTELGQTFDKLSDAKKGVEKLSKAHQELAKNGEISFSTLADIQKTMTGVIPDIDSYVKSLAGMKGNNKEAYRTLTDLAVRFVQNKVGLQDMTDANKGYIKSMLDEMGITNSDTIATYAIANAKQRLAIQNALASGTISDITSNLDKEAAAAGMSKNAFVELIFEETLANNTGLNFAQQIEALNELAVAAGYAASAYQVMLEVMTGSNASSSKANGYVGGFQDISDKDSSTSEQVVKDKYKNYFKQKMGEIESDAPTAAYAPAKGSGSKNKSGSAEPYTAEIDDFYKQKAKVTEITNSIDLLKDKLDMLTSDSAVAEYLQNVANGTEKENSLFKDQIAILDQQISKYQEKQSALHDLNIARREAIQRNIEDLTKQGFVVDYDATNNKLLIENREHLNELNDGSVEATNKLIKKYEELIKKTETLNDANVESSKTWYELQKSIDDTKKQYDELYNKITSNEKDRIDRIKDSISHEKDALEKEKELYEDEKNRVEVTVKVIQDAIDKKKDALQEANDALERQLDLEKKLEALEKAKDQRNKRIYHKGTGFEWDYDASEIKSLQEDYDQQKKKNDFDDKIKALEKQKEKWQEVLDSYQKKLDSKDTADVILQKILGYAWSGDYADVPITAITEFTDYYGKQCDQLNKDVDGSVAQQIKHLEDLSDQWDEAEYQIEKTADDYEGKLEEVKAFEKLNFDDRLAYIKNFVAQAKSALMELGQLQGSPEAISEGYKTSTDNGETVDIQSRIDAIVNGKSNYDSNGKLVQDALDELKFLETERNRKIAENSLPYEQTNKYGGTIFPVNGGSSGSGDTTARIGGAFGDTLVQLGDNLEPMSAEEVEKSAQEEMKKNSADWHTATTDAEKKKLADKNAQIGAALGYNRGDDGVWRDPNGNRVYANGGVNDFTGLAMLHGTPSAAETIFNSSDSKKLYDYVHTNSILNDRLAAMNILNNNQFKGITTGGGSSSITIESGAIVLNGVEDTDTLANAIVTELAPKLRQKLYNNK